MDFFNNLSPTAKSKLISVMVVIGVFTTFIFLAKLSEKDKEHRIKRPEKVKILTTQDPRSLGMDAVTARTLLLEKEQAKLTAENKRLQVQVKKLKEKNALRANIRSEYNPEKHIKEELKKTKAELKMFFEQLIEESKQKKVQDNLNSNPELIANRFKKIKNENNLNQEKVEKEIEIKRKPNFYTAAKKFSYAASSQPQKALNQPVNIKNESIQEPIQDSRNADLFTIIEPLIDQETEEKTKNDDSEIYLPQGAILTGVLITGMDAPTSASAQDTPYPSLVRIKKEAILPNYRTLQEVRECFALLGGYGDLSSERVMFRGEGISCIYEDGKRIETKFSAYAVGEDAKAGLRGRLVSRNSKVLVNAMLSGFASGLASAFDVNPVPVLATDPGGEQQYQKVFSNSALQGGVAKGASSAMEKLADYYMELADATHPVIEISSGRIINIVVTKGTTM